MEPYMGLSYDDILEAKEKLYRNYNKPTDSIWIPKSLEEEFHASMRISHTYTGYIGSLSGVPVFFFDNVTDYILYCMEFEEKHNRKPYTVVINP